MRDTFGLVVVGGGGEQHDVYIDYIRVPSGCNCVVSGRWLVAVGHGVRLITDDRLLDSPVSVSPETCLWV